MFVDQNGRNILSFAILLNVFKRISESFTCIRKYALLCKNIKFKHSINKKNLYWRRISKSHDGRFFHVLRFLKLVVVSSWHLYGFSCYAGVSSLVESSLGFLVWWFWSTLRVIDCCHLLGGPIAGWRVFLFGAAFLLVICLVVSCYFLLVFVLRLMFIGRSWIYLISFFRSSFSED